MTDTTQARHDGGQTVRILFVCTGNTCRSPMAAALMAARLPGVDVSSAGTGRYADDGDPAADLACVELRRRDALACDGAAAAGPLSTRIDAHRSRSVTADLVRAADVIVCM